MVFMTTGFRSFADAQRDAPDRLAEHVATSKQLPYPRPTGPCEVDVSAALSLDGAPAGD
jgi:hypothetical protein